MPGLRSAPENRRRGHAYPMAERVLRRRAPPERESLLTERMSQRGWRKGLQGQMHRPSEQAPSGRMSSIAGQGNFDHESMESGASSPRPSVLQTGAQPSGIVLSTSSESSSQEQSPRPQERRRRNSGLRQCFMRREQVTQETQGGGLSNRLGWIRAETRWRWCPCASTNASGR